MSLRLAAGCSSCAGRRALDDPGAQACGRCDNCGGVQLASSTDQAVVAQAQARIDRPGVAIEPRRIWPVGMAELGVAVRGKIAADQLPEPGRAVARLTDLGWGAALRELFADATRDQEVPVPLRRALTDVLDDWFDADGPPRPDAIVGVRSLSRRLLVEHLSDGLSRYLHIPVVSRFEIVSSAGSRQGAMNSAHRLRAVHDRYQRLDAAAVEGRRVLLVDDRVDTGWTMTVLARALRLAGAGAVYPIALATTT